MAVLTPANNTCYPKGCAATREIASLEDPEQTQSDISPIKNECDKQVSHTDKNRYYT